MRNNLGIVFGLSLESMPAEEFAEHFVRSSVARMIESGEPDYLAGKSGHELYRLMFSGELDMENGVPKETGYWIGHTVAYLQWYWSVTFGELEETIPISELCGLYGTLHECDISKINEIVGKRLHPRPFIAERRKELGLTQRQLSAICGLSLATVRAYEQGTLSPNNAEAENIYRLSKALGCTVEELLIESVRTV